MSVRKHREEMIYSCGEGVGRKTDAEERMTCQRSGHGN